MRTPANLALVTGFGSYSEPRFRHYSRGLFWIRWISPKLGLSYSPCEDSIGLTPRCSLRSLGQERSQINFETYKACSTCQGRHLTDSSGCRSAGRRPACSRDGASSRKRFIRVRRLIADVNWNCLCTLTVTDRSRCRNYRCILAQSQSSLEESLDRL